MEDPVQDRVAEIDVARAHVDPGTQHPGAVGEVATAHLAEQLEVLVDGPIPPGAVPARLRERAAVFPDLVRRQVVDVREAEADQLDRPLVELLEVVRREEQVLAPVEAQPAHIRLDGVDVLLLLLDRVRVVESQMASAAEIRRETEVEADGLGVADVQIAVGFGRETGHDLRMAATPQVVGDDLADEVAALRQGWGLRAHQPDATTPAACPRPRQALVRRL